MSDPAPLVLHHAPPVISVANYTLIKSPLLGGELKAYISPISSVDLGTFTVTGADAGTLALNTDAAAQLSAVPMDVVVMLDNAVPDAGAQDVTLTLAGTDDATTAITDGTAVLKVPGYAQVAARTFPRCFAVDLKLAANRKVKTITGVTVDCAAAAAGTRFRLFGVPPIASFNVVGCVDEKDFSLRVQDATAIACGLNASAFVKPGMIQPGTVNITAKSINDADGLARYVGRPVTVMIEGVRESRISTERYFFLRTTFGLQKRGPAGQETVMDTANGIAEESLMMLAPSE
jgi:hypothetical protein